uniref:Uncharacterized protein n=1 Tax=Panagrolaimus sp. ES5 TaxID=591445 RepID=A0AC34FTW6_9BILA
MSTSGDLVIFVTAYNEYVTLINIETKKCSVLRVSNFSTFSNNNEFFKCLEAAIYLPSVKAIVFDACVAPRRVSALEEYQHRLKCLEFCHAHGVFCLMLAPQEFCATVTFSQVCPVVKENEIVILSMVESQTTIHSAFFFKQSDGFRILDSNFSQSLSFSEKWKRDFVKKYNYQPTMLITVSQSSEIDISHHVGRIKKCFETIRIIHNLAYNTELDSQVGPAMVEKVLHVMGERKCNFFVKFPCMREFFIRFGKTTMITVDTSMYLPFMESVIVKRDNKTSVTLYYHISSEKSAGPEILEEIQMSTFKSKKVKITLEIDINSIYDLKVEPVDDHGNLQSVCMNPVAAVQDESFKIIFEKESFSIFLDNNVLKDECGLEKIPLYLCVFTYHGEDVVNIGEHALDNCRVYSEAVVHDILEVASISDIDEVNPRWKFKFCEEGDQFMVKMKSISHGEYEKEGVKCSVPFLLALFLKHASDRVKKEIGKRMKMVEISFDDDIEENKTLKKNFIEAGKLFHNIDIHFV